MKKFNYNYYYIFIGINEKIVHGICKTISLTLHRYKDTASQSYVKNLIEELLKKQPEPSIKHMINIVIEQAAWHKNVVPTYVNVT